MWKRFRGVPILPLSFGLLVISAIVLGTWIFGIEWDPWQLELTLIAIIVLGVGLAIGWWSRRN